MIWKTVSLLESAEKWKVLKKNQEDTIMAKADKESIRRKQAELFKDILASAQEIIDDPESTPEDINDAEQTARAIRDGLERLKTKYGVAQDEPPRLASIRQKQADHFAETKASAQEIIDDPKSTPEEIAAAEQTITAMTDDLERLKTKYGVAPTGSQQTTDQTTEETHTT
jgi:chromosome segregation ATPase